MATATWFCVEYGPVMGTSCRRCGMYCEAYVGDDDEEVSGLC